ncbi:hypothetical protein [Lentimonas sp. CC10]|uniref:hypothetical protein n=2 Tax=Lentimonas TaxID=417293 RepID=UPI001A7E6D27|nr:hypothetical protein [Lentimonas sp. CC10]
MSTHTHMHQKIISGLFFAGVALALNITAQAQPAPPIDLYRVPAPSEQRLQRIQKNLARWHMGATLVLVKDEQFLRIQVPDVGYFDESVLLSDNSALTYTIPQGQHDYIIDLGQFMKVSRFFFNNESASGTMQIMSSNTLDPLNSGKWVTLTQPVSFSEGVIPSASFAEVDTRYLLVRFNILNQGRIGHFGATGSMDITKANIQIGKGEETKETIKAQSPIIDYDFGAAYTGSRIIYASGGALEEVYHLQDDDPTTTHQFPSDEESIVIIDLRKKTQMRSIASSFNSGQSGTLQIYLTNHLPSEFTEDNQTGVATYTNELGHVERAEFAAKNDSNFEYLMAATTPQQIVRVPNDFFFDIEDSYSVYVKGENTRLHHIFDEIERRYVIVRFTPENLQSDYKIETAQYMPGSTDLRIHKAQAAPPPFSFGGIDVIGDVPFEDIFFTADAEPGLPGPPPPPPPPPPPVFSQ